MMPANVGGGTAVASNSGESRPPSPSTVADSGNVKCLERPGSP